MATINYQDPLHLAVMVQGRLSVDRPDALVIVTSNPGEGNEHYIGLIQRVYSNKNDLKTFVGYIAYRYCEVKYKKKREHLPVFSSIELRNADFDEYKPSVKVHFLDYKVNNEDPKIYQEAETVVAASGLIGDDAHKLLANEIGKRVFEKAYAKILDFIDHKI